MDHAFVTLEFAAVDKVPVAAGVAVPAPVGDGGHVADDAVYGLGCGGGETEVANGLISDLVEGYEDLGDLTVTNSIRLPVLWSPRPSHFQTEQLACSSM